MSTHADPPFLEGQRVEFAVELERRPHFTVPAGATAVVDYADDSFLTLQMEQPIPGLEDSDNQVDFESTQFAEALRVLRVRVDR